MKILLRRNAAINAQNNAGNSVLHYCFEYGHEKLGHYLMRKGADDSILNAVDHRCYEGLDRDKIDLL